MTTGDQYRANAAAQRAAAAKTQLSNRSAMHERSALVWDEMADAAEEHTKKVVVNAAAKSDWCSGKPKSISERASEPAV